MPSFVASVFFFICSIQSFFGGLILQTVIKKEKQDFEIKLNQYKDRFNDIKRKEEVSRNGKIKEIKRSRLETLENGKI